MQSVRKWIRNLFGFSGNEINGFLILVPLMVLLVASEPVYHALVANQVRQVDIAPFDSVVAPWIRPSDDAEARVVVQPAALFHFDPNVVSVPDLVRLGFSERLATRIAAYRRKGGVFTMKSDLLKIYGLDSALYEQLYPYISLPAGFVKRSRQQTFHSGVGGGTTAPGKKQGQQKFDINTADTLLLKSVYGIGSRLAARIIKFRDALGGFVTSDQLFEVYGLDSVTVARLHQICFITADFIPEKINVNTATEETLSAHPYIRYRLARLLVSYRFQHGDFTDINDIKKLSVVETDKVDRVLPYLTVGDR